MTKYILLAALGGAALHGGDLTRRAEIAGFGGGLHIFDAGDHGVYGGLLGYGLTRRAQVFAEASHAPLQGSLDLVDFQAGAKYSLSSHDIFEPYAAAAIGAGHFSNPVASNTGFGLSAGFGARVYLRPRWGVAPDIRWTRYFFDGPDTIIFRYTAGVFFQWGR
jgi:hypothetical protein